MNLNSVLLAKADPLLQDALRNASGGQVLRAVLVLRSEPMGGDGPEPSPTAYPSRAEYRRALIERQRQRVEHGEVGRTKRVLEGMDLKPRGGLLATVVVEGPADQLAAALELPGVVHGDLDRPVHLVNPRPSEE